MLINPYIFGGAPPGPDIAFRAASAFEVLPNFGGVVTIDKPAGTVENDIMLAWFAIEAVNASSFPVINLPAGWALVEDVGTDQFFQLRVYYKVAGASEPASYDFDVVNPPPLFNGGDASMVSYSGADPAAPIDDFDEQITASGSNNVTCPSLTATVVNTMLVCFFGGTDGNSQSQPINDAASTTQRQATSGTDYSQCTVADENLTAIGATGTRVGTYQGAGSFPSRCISVLLKKANP